MGPRSAVLLAASWWALGCGGEPPPRHARVVAAATPAPVPVPPPAAAPAPVPPAPTPPQPVPVPPAPVTTPCSVFEATLTRNGRSRDLDVSVREVTVAEGDWQPGRAPPALSRTEAEARGRRNVEFSEVGMTIPGAPGPVGYRFDASNRTVQSSTRPPGRNRFPIYEYVYFYDCSGIPVFFPDRMPSTCRAMTTGGLHIVCGSRSDPDRVPCDTDPREADLTDDPGNETVIACEFNCSQEEYSWAHVVLANGVPRWAVRTTEDMGCQTATISPGRRGSLARLTVEGGGEDGTYRATYTWRDGAMHRVRWGYRPSDY